MFEKCNCYYVSGSIIDCFDIFRIDNFYLTNEPCGRQESRLNDDELKVTVVFSSSQSAYELSLKFVDNNSLCLNKVIFSICKLLTSFALFLCKFHP